MGRTLRLSKRTTHAICAISNVAKRGIWFRMHSGTLAKSRIDVTNAVYRLDFMGVWIGISKRFIVMRSGTRFSSIKNTVVSELTADISFELQCVMCDRNFKTKFRLKEHFNTHTGTDPHQCSQCARTYRYKNSLTRHIAKCHRGERKIGGKAIGLDVPKSKNGRK